MPHDPELIAETRAWLAKASLDLAAAQQRADGLSAILVVGGQS